MTDAFAYLLLIIKYTKYWQDNISSYFRFVILYQFTAIESNCCSNAWRLVTGHSTPSCTSEFLQSARFVWSQKCILITILCVGSSKSKCKSFLCNAQQIGWIREDAAIQLRRYPDVFIEHSDRYISIDNLHYLATGLTFVDSYYLIIWTHTKIVRKLSLEFSMICEQEIVWKHYEDGEMR